MGEVIKGSDVLLLTGFDNKFLRKCPYIIFWTEDKLIKLACFGRNFYEVKYQETDFPSFFLPFLTLIIIISFYSLFIFLGTNSYPILAH